MGGGRGEGRFVGQGKDLIDVEPGGRRKRVPSGRGGGEKRLYITAKNVQKLEDNRSRLEESIKTRNKSRENRKAGGTLCYECAYVIGSKSLIILFENGKAEMK